MPSILKKFENAVLQNNLLAPKDKIVIGVSGGADSLCLTYLLNSLRHSFGLQLHIVHVDHHLRPNSGKDALFVKQFAAVCKIPFTAASVHIRRTRAVTSIEELAREERFKKLIAIAKKQGADKIALGHTQDDLAETVLLRIVRGSGLTGLRGILPKRLINQFAFIRPLLNIRRQEIERFLRTKKIKFLTDPTNANKDFLRNRIRWELLPLLEKKYNKNVRQVLSHLADSVNTDYDYLEEQGKKAFVKITAALRQTKSIKINLNALCGLHPSLQRMVIRLAIERLKGNTRQLTFAHIREILNLLDFKTIGARVNLPAGIYVTREKNALSFHRGKS